MKKLEYQELVLGTSLTAIRGARLPSLPEEDPSVYLGSVEMSPNEKHVAWDWDISRECQEAKRYVMNNGH